MKWLHHHVKPTDLVAMKMDVEKAEFELVAELLKSPKTARPIDEPMLECHHAETRDLPPATYRDCLEMFRSLQAPAFGRMSGFALLPLRLRCDSWRDRFS